MIWIPPEIWKDRRLEGLPVDIAGDTAFRIFCTPVISERRQPNHHLLTERARYHLRRAAWERISSPVGEIQTYVFEPDIQPALGLVLIVHGWTAEASFMSAVAEPIRRAGFRVVLLDLPAHGLSSGRSTHMMDCARAVVAVGQHFGPAHAVVSHSFGGLISLVAAEGLPPMQGRLEAGRIVLIASPNRLTDVTDFFASHWRLEADGKRAFEKRLERVGGRPIGDFTAVKLLRKTQLPALLVHAPDDADVPYSCAEQIAADIPGTSLLTFEGLGHRNILSASPPIRAVTAYLTQAQGSA